MTTTTKGRGAKKPVTINDWTGLGGRRSLEQISKLFNIVYVAGPMTGYENFNFPAFDAGRDYVNSIEKGRKAAPKPLAAVSPADMDRAHGFDEIAASQTPVGAVVSPTFFFDCMRRDMELVSRAFAILLMRGWEESTGANHELFFARACGVKVWLANYDASGAIIGHVEAPEWLRSPKVYGDNGNPAYTSTAPALHGANGVEHTPLGISASGFPALSEEELAASEEQVVRTEVDQTLTELPLKPPPLEYKSSRLGEVPGVQARIATVKPDGQTVLEEANHLIYGPRNADYGHPIEDFSRTGIMWSGVLRDWALTVTDPRNVPPVPPELVGLCQVEVKVSREVNKHKRDNLVDIGGYAGTVDMVATYREEHPENPETIEVGLNSGVKVKVRDDKIVGRTVTPMGGVQEPGGDLVTVAMAAMLRDHPEMTEDDFVRPRPEDSIETRVVTLRPPS